MPKIGKYWVDKDLHYWPHDTAHSWAKNEDGKIRVGVDDFAQKQAGELKFMRLFPAGKKVKQGKRFGTLETGQVGRTIVVTRKRIDRRGQPGGFGPADAGQRRPLRRWLAINHRAVRPG